MRKMKDNPIDDTTHSHEKQQQTYSNLTSAEEDFISQFIISSNAIYKYYIFELINVYIFCEIPYYNLLDDDVDDDYDDALARALFSFLLQTTTKKTSLHDQSPHAFSQPCYL